MSGILYVTGTPIGNLGDFSPRAAETLESVDFIAAEDTRVTLKLLNHFGIKKPMVSYFEHNKRERGEIICNRIEQGENCAIVTDAGMPCISDPGEDLIKLCEAAGSVFTAQQAVQIVARGGKIMMVGTQSKPVPIDFLKINREVMIQTSFRYCNNFPQTIEAIASGKFNVKDMITNIYDYKDVQQAFMDAIDPEKKANMVKGVIKVAD